MYCTVRTISADDDRGHGAIILGSHHDDHLCKWQALDVYKCTD